MGRSLQSRKTHSSLGPGIPDLEGCQRAKACGHHIPIDHQLVTKVILGGLHHEYRSERYARLTVLESTGVEKTLPVADPRLEDVELYKVSNLKVIWT